MDADAPKKGPQMYGDQNKPINEPGGQGAIPRIPYPHNLLGLAAMVTLACLRSVCIAAEDFQNC